MCIYIYMNSVDKMFMSLFSYRKVPGISLQVAQLLRVIQEPISPNRDLADLRQLALGLLTRRNSNP